jgi:tRNA threonylcarbamoyladenosine biosynthesis protein TsaE
MNASSRAQRSIFLPDETATLDLGQRLAAVVAPGLYLALSGELGSGKTTLVRGLLRGLGYAGKVKSPTYTLVEFYNLSKLDLYHFDLYRFNDPQEWLDAGFRDYFQPGNLCVVEWPERAQELLPTADLQVALNEESGARRARILAKTEYGIHCLERLPE